MRRTPPGVYKHLVATRPPCERQAAFADHRCQGHSTMEHALIYAGKQIVEPWAIIRLCAWAHSVNEYQDRGGLVKDINELLALRHATDADLARYPNRDWSARRSYLEKKYGGKT